MLSDGSAEEIFKSDSNRRVKDKSSSLSGSVQFGS